MAHPLTSVAALIDPPLAGFDALIDVRSPSEYAEDHMPGAINLPALDDAERARVGTVYVQQSPFLARRIGAALVARNVARHLETALADCGPRWRPLVYCWRGGQRSASVATILRAVGWRAEVVEGGWRSWRRCVVESLDGPFPAPVVLLDGNTGTAKTALLDRLALRGVQVIDLEGMARHRGSIFGARAGGQPMQKGFDTALAVAIARLDPSRPVVVEAESARIGALRLPKGLWAAMRAAPRLVVSAPLDARADYLCRAYADIVVDGPALAAAIEGLRPFHPREVIESWLDRARRGEMAGLAADLMARHYDPAYLRARTRQGLAADVGHFHAETLDDAGLDTLAGRLQPAVSALAPASPV